MIIKKSRNILIAMISVCMIFTCVPMAVYGEVPSTGEVPSPGETAEYALCIEENGVLTPAPESWDESIETFIGQKKTLTLAWREGGNSSSVWTKLTDDQAAGFAAAWKITSPVADAVSCTAIESPTASKEFRMEKEASDTDDTAVVSVTLKLSENKEVTKKCYINIYDGYNPGFDPDDEKSVIKVIKDAEEAGATVPLAAGSRANSVINTNDGLCIFKFHPEKMRWYTFEDVSEGQDSTCAYLFSYDSEPPEEIGSAETCDLLAAKEFDEGHVMIGRDDYEGPLEQCYESTEYYLIVKYYKSSKLGKIKVACDISSGSDIYEPALHYWLLDSESEEEIPLIYEYSGREKKYIAKEILPYNCDTVSSIYTDYLDSDEKRHIKSDLKEGRNIIIEASDATYVIDIVLEKPEDMMFSGFAYQDSGWEGEEFTYTDFSDEGQLTLHLPRNSKNKQMYLHLSSICSSSIQYADWEKDSEIDIPFVYSDAEQGLEFKVYPADETSLTENPVKTFTIYFTESEGLDFEAVSAEYMKGTDPEDPEKDIFDRIEFSEFEETGEAILQIPAWYEDSVDMNADFELLMDDETADTDFSSEKVISCIKSFLSTGEPKIYEFSVFDSEHPEKYSKKYTLSLKKAKERSAQLKKAYISWYDESSDSTVCQDAEFVCGSGTKEDPYLGTIRLPEGITLTNDYYMMVFSAFSRNGGEISLYDFGAYYSAGFFAEYFMDDSSKSQVVKFMIKSPDGKVKKYYKVRVLDADKALAKGSAFIADKAVYKVAATGEKASASYVKPLENVKSGIPAYVKEGKVKYKVKKILPSAFKNAKQIRTLKVSTPYLTKKGIKDCLKSSKITTVKCMGKAAKSSVFAKYKKYFTKKNCGKKIKVTK